jgi:hypothetical protein
MPKMTILVGMQLVVSVIFFTPVSAAPVNNATQQPPPMTFAARQAAIKAELLKRMPPGRLAELEEHMRELKGQFAEYARLVLGSSWESNMAMGWTR